MTDGAREGGREEGENERRIHEERTGEERGRQKDGQSEAANAKIRKGGEETEAAKKKEAERERVEFTAVCLLQQVAESLRLLLLLFR